MYHNSFPFIPYIQQQMVSFPVNHSPSPYVRTYPPIDINVFSHSIHSFRILLDQGKILLERLGNPAFSRRIMHAAQQGNKAEVDRLVKSIGLKVPVTAKFTPSGINFELSMQPSHTHANCCILAFLLRWGQ